MRKLSLLLLILSILTGCVSTGPNTRVTAVSVNLPTEIEWKKTTARLGNQQISEVHFPASSSAKNADWVIIVQKLAVRAKNTAEDYLMNMFKLSHSACSDVSFNGPVEIIVSDHKTAVGRIMCAEQLGKSHGTFTDQRVVVGDGVAYVVTSELRIPASSKAGVLAFGNDEVDKIAAFMKKQKQSASLVRESVNIDLL